MRSTGLLEQARQTSNWPLVAKGQLTLLQSPLLSIYNDRLVHAFTTRRGANSPEPLQSFNLGRHWQTEESKVDAIKNRGILCNELGVDAELLTVPSQQHTGNVLTFGGDDPHPGLNLPLIDGVATDKVGYPVLLHFADCVPIIVFDRNQGIICVIHAGWRGTASGIAKNGVVSMQQRFNSKPGDIVAAVGPAIGSCCFQTGVDVAELLAKSESKATGLIEQRQGHPYPDLKAINALQLLESGVSQVDVTQWCTACNPDIFYSHRQSGGLTGRQGALACII